MTTGAMQFAGGFAGIPAPPAFDTTAQAATFAPLTGSGFPIIQDRWERLVSMGNTPAPPEQVWAALTDPDHVRHWLAVCRGRWAERDAESMLDCEDGEFFFCRTPAASHRPRPGPAP